MGDVKFCASCGTSLPTTSLFCYNCGQKQENFSESMSMSTTEYTEQSSVNDEPVIGGEHLHEVEVVPSDEVVAADAEPSGEIEERNDISELFSQEEAVTIEEPEGEQSLETEPLQEGGIDEIDEIPDDTVIADPVSETVKQEESEPVAPPQIQADIPPQPQYQPPVHPENMQPQQAATEKAGKKKKFPWVFTVLWLLFFAAVGIWAYFLFIHPTYDYPVFTEDAKRFIVFTAAVASLIYTLSLKLTMRKLKAIPTVLIVLLGLTVFFFFCMVELTDGDFLHDTLSNLIENIIPASGG